MNMFADKESPAQVASRVADELRSYLKGHPAIKVTVAFNGNQVFIQPSTGVPFEITCDGPDTFRMKSIRSASGFQQQVYERMPAWSDHQRFDERGMVDNVKEWLATQTR